MTSNYPPFTRFENVPSEDGAVRATSRAALRSTNEPLGALLSADLRSELISFSAMELSRRRRILDRRSMSHVPGSILSRGDQQEHQLGY